MINPWLILAAAIALIGAYAYGRHDGSELASAQRQRDEQVARQVFDRAQAAAAAEIAKIKVRHTTVNAEVRREIHKEPVYRDCVNTDVGLRGINAALVGTQPADSGKLPAAVAPD
jgi:hypothetical protein